MSIPGHAHGGRLRPLTQVALAGLSRVGPTWLYVTRGTGFRGPAVRVGRSPS